MDTSLRYATRSTDLGELLLVASSRGVCLVRFGRDEAELLELLRREFPCAGRRPDPEGLRPWMDALLAVVGGRPPRETVPLDVRGSRFQRRVWQALTRIPSGETRSYREVARALGAPGAARAVGSACATNPVPLLVPCHRVVRGDGSLGGFVGGVWRKRALLGREQQRTLEDTEQEDRSWTAPRITSAEP